VTIDVSQNVLGANAKNPSRASSSRFKPRLGQYWRSLRALKETRPKEHGQQYLAASNSIMDSRICGFLQFLELLPWECFILVGHSRFFNKMFRKLGADVYMLNANIWKAVVVVQPGRQELQLFGKPELIASPARDEAVGSPTNSANSADSDDD